MKDALTIMREALKRIENPLKWEVEHVPEGYDIDGAMVVSMTEKAPYYQRVAREALATVDALGVKAAPMQCATCPMETRDCAWKCVPNCRLADAAGVKTPDGGQP